VACFFEEPWSRLAPGLSEGDQAWLLAVAAFNLRALGRLAEAVQPMRVGLEARVRQEVWKSAAIIANNVSELELTLGDVAAAVAGAEQSVAHADRSGDAFQRMGNRTTLADALHQAGRRAEASARFREAEALQAEQQPAYPLLYSLRGFRYCDLLLAEVERAAAREDRRGEGSGALAEVERRATQTLQWAIDTGLSLLTVALDHLTLARVALYRALLEPERAIEVLAMAREHAEPAVSGLRAAGTQDHLPRGLLTRAWLRVVEGDAAHAKADLDDAQRIAERGSMRLHLADVHLHRARLFHDRRALAEARRLIEEIGYHRRDGELADAEDAARSWGVA
jgi:tetratricopeptide (TPR) repeat protein